MGLRRFERRLEKLVEGTIDRVFRSGLSPLEVGRRIVAEIDANTTAGPDGSRQAPNRFTVYLAAEDHQRLTDAGSTVTSELERAIHTHLADESISAAGPVRIQLVEALDYQAGTVGVVADFDRPAPTAPAASLLFGDGQRVTLVDPTVIGRSDSCTIVLAATDASREHAVIAARHNAWYVRDLGSTNGTTVNTVPITEAQLFDNDRVTFGSTRARVEFD